ncbi:hypothetical protein D3C78_1655530 [compost metagenome]
MTTRSITCPPISTRVILHAGHSANAQNARVTMESISPTVGAGQAHHKALQLRA